MHQRRLVNATGECQQAVDYLIVARGPRDNSGTPLGQGAQRGVISLRPATTLAETLARGTRRAAKIAEANSKRGWVAGGGTRRAAKIAEANRKRVT